MIYTIKNQKGEYVMSLKKLQSIYRKKVEETGLYRVAFPKSEQASNENFSFSLKHLSSGIVIQSRGQIIDDVLLLFPFTSQYQSKHMDEIFVMDFWISYAKFHSLTTIRSQAKLREFVFVRESSFYEIPLSDLTKLFPICQATFTTLKKFHAKDITFDYYNSLPHTEEGFLSFTYEWEGMTRILELLLVHGQCHLIHAKQGHIVDENTIPNIIPSILLEVAEQVKLKNLLHPPIQHLLSLLNQQFDFHMHNGFEETANIAMELFTSQGFTYKEIETEAVRIKNSTDKKDIFSFDTPNQITSRFFNSHFLTILYDKSEQTYQIHVVTSEEEVIELYQNLSRKLMKLQFEQQIQSKF